MTELAGVSVPVFPGCHYSLHGCASGAFPATFPPGRGCRYARTQGLVPCVPHSLSRRLSGLSGRFRLALAACIALDCSIQAAAHFCRHGRPVRLRYPAAHLYALRSVNSCMTSGDSLILSTRAERRPGS